jgi:hypothetical protein
VVLVLTVVCALTAGVLGAVVGLAVPAVAAPASGPGAQPDPAARVAVLVETLEPPVPQPGDVLQVGGSVVNRAAEQFDDVQISLHLGTPLTGRAALAAQRAAPTAQPLASRPVALADGRLEPGARQPFSLSVPAADLLTRGAGVYPLQVTVVGRTTEGFRDLGSADTFLPFVPTAGGAGATATGGTTGAAPADPLRIAWLLPLTDRPRLSATGGVTDDELARSLAPGGRLADILAAANAVPAATVVVDPALLRAVSIVASGRYPVGIDRTIGINPADPDARAWLNRLTSAVGAGNGRVGVVPTAFADADLETLVHAGRIDLARQVVGRGAASVRETLGTAASSELAVPPGGRIDRAGAEFLTGVGASSALLAPDATAGPGQIGTAGPGRIDSAGRSLTPVIPDPELGRLLRAGPTISPTPRLAEQSVLAELAQAHLSGSTSASPSAPVVLAPGNDWAPVGGWATRIATDTARFPWLKPIGLPELLQDSRTRSAGRSAELRYPDAARSAELPADLVPPVTDTLAAVAGFAEALPRRQTVTRTVTDTALTALSASWRSDRAGSEARRQSAEAGLGQLRGSVRAVASREITLTSQNGRLPVTLENNLPEEVNVNLRLTSLDRSRVQSDTSVSRTIQPGQKVQVEVTVRATSAGTFPVRLTLLTPTGRPLGPPEQILIRSTAAGVVAIGVTVAALAVLLLAVLGRGVRSLLRRRRRRTPISRVAT